MEDITFATGFVGNYGGGYPSQAVARQHANRPGPRNFYTAIKVLPNDGQPVYEHSVHDELTHTDAMADFHESNRAIVKLDHLRQGYEAGRTNGDRGF